MSPSTTTTVRPVGPFFTLRSITSLLLLTLLLVVGCDDEPKKAGKGASGGDDAALAGGDSAGGLAAIETEPVDNPDATYTFRFTPKVGELYRYRLTQRNQVVIDTMKGNEETIYTFTHKVVGVNDDGSVTVEMSYENIAFRSSVPATPLTKARTVAYNTSQKVDSTVPGALQAKALVGKKVTLTVSSEGEITEVGNLEPIVSAVLGRMRDSLPAEAREQIRLGIKVAAFQSVAQQLFMRSTPDTAVKVGATWNRRDTLALDGTPANITATYRLSDARVADDRQLGVVRVDLDFAFPERKIETKAMLLTVDKAEASGSGEVVVFLGNGFPLSRSTRIEIMLVRTVKAKDGPNKGAQQTVTQRTVQTSKVELLARE